MMDGQTDSHSDYSAHLRGRAILFRLLKQSVSARAVPEFIAGEAGRQSNFSVNLRPRFAHQWPDKVKMYK